MVEQAAWIAIGLVIGGCSPHALEEGQCTSDGDTSLSRRVNPGPNCNGAAHAQECAWAGAPSAYGVEEGCELPATYADPVCLGRPRKLEGCVPVGHLICCPK